MSRNNNGFKNQVIYFEIPADDVDGLKNFYSFFI